jgi:hypothetical protein
MTDSKGGSELDPADIIVVVRHPFGDVEATLAHWIATGPGPRRLVRPVSARSRLTGASLPLSVIPPPYRNNGESRAAIERGALPDPWPTPPAQD